MKPLELTIHPPVPPKPSDDTSLEWALWWADRGYEASLTAMKRLEDAELAAEYHAMDALLTHSEGAALCIAVDRMHRLRVLRRFATNPHYDEADS